MSQKKKCQFCEGEAAFLCDHILGWTKERMFHRCDAALCDKCRTVAGYITLDGVDSIDKCPRHVGKCDAEIDAPVMSNKEAEAIRRRMRFQIVGANLTEKQRCFEFLETQCKILER